MVNFKYVLSSTSLGHWKSSRAFSESQDTAAEVCVSCFTGDLVSGLIRINCMQQCHRCQELKLGCSKQIIRNGDSLAKNLSCVGQKCYSLMRKAELLFCTLRWQSAALKAVPSPVMQNWLLK